MGVVLLREGLYCLGTMSLSNTNSIQDNTSVSIAEHVAPNWLVLLRDIVPKQYKPQKNSINNFHFFFVILFGLLFFFVVDYYFDLYRFRPMSLSNTNPQKKTERQVLGVQFFSFMCIDLTSGNVVFFLFLFFLFFRCFFGFCNQVLH